jgi:RND family efflux transporter MFP subunit
MISASAYAADFDAVLDWAEIFVVGFPMDGSIAQVYVRPGQLVSEGTTLIELDNEPIAIRIRQYQAAVAADKAVLADAKRQFEQAQSLYEQTVLADDELQRALNAYEKARAQLASANARLDYARWQLKKANVTAPWDAWVVQRHADPGQILVAEQRAQPLLVLAKSGVMGAMTDVPATHIDTLSVGQHATVVIGGQSFTAKVATVGMQSEANKRGDLYRVEVAFDVADKKLFRAGQAATIRFR